ncbi:MAG: TauD/TfdA family dioxygenase [Betaproteobacteria bacterium]|nr:MAG: TauD/TfdA family dioxygenase [Betaproteobacteria bacterium]
MTTDSSVLEISRPGSDTPIRITPLSDALGAEITGLDLTGPVTGNDLELIRSAFLEYHLLCFRSQPLTAADFSRVARYFGEPQFQLLRHQRVDEVPEVSILESTYTSAEDKPDDLQLVRLSGWHTDDSYFEIPAKATVLQILARPSSGGETRFCNTGKAYEDLSDEMKQRLSALKAVHGYDTMRAPARAQARNEVETQETPDVVHPLIRTHEDTGKKAIYFNPNRTDHIVGIDRKDSDELLDWLYAHFTQPKYRYDHQWQTGDILLWDNRCLIHSVNTDFPVGEPRIHQRILLKGTRPV